VCSITADTLLKGCGADTSDNYLVATATCQNLANGNARNKCLAEAQATRKDDISNCNDVHEARLAVCNAVGKGAYDPHFGPAYAKNFVDPLQIGRSGPGSVPPNPYFPLIQGSQWKYLSTHKDENGDKVTERDTVTVTNRTKLINGITCLVVTDIVQSTDGTVEETEDWYAQDVQGNVWYCGEIAQQKETFDGDKPPKLELVGIDGSWKTGREGGKPGIQMLAHPKVGKSYRQELAWVEAEDVAKVLALNADEFVSGVGFSCHKKCVETRDYSALEPGADEHKYYAPGIGLMLEVDLANGARNELVSYTHPHP
jgi:hypothetical protein